MLSSEKLIGEWEDSLGHILKIGNETKSKPEQRVRCGELKTREKTQDPEIPKDKLLELGHTWADQRSEGRSARAVQGLLFA
jgi:hypothetical protein